MADEQVINQLKERVAFLETLVMSLVAKNQPSADSAATQASRNTGHGAQDVSATIDKKPAVNASLLMKLPRELRMDILEKALHPIVAKNPYEITSASLDPISIYTSRPRVPAVLQVNQIMRAESKKIFLDLARARIAKLDIETKKLQEEHRGWIEALKKARQAGPTRRRTRDFLGSNIKKNYETMAELDSSCRVLGGNLERK